MAPHVVRAELTQRQQPPSGHRLSAGGRRFWSVCDAGTGGEALDLLNASAQGDDALWRLLGSLPYYDIDAVYALEWEDRPDVLREDLNIVDMSRAEWRAVAGEADIVVHY